jgi:hypothetical protein
LTGVSDDGRQRQRRLTESLGLGRTGANDANVRVMWEVLPGGRGLGCPAAHVHTWSRPCFVRGPVMKGTNRPQPAHDILAARRPQPQPSVDVRRSP